MSARSANLPLWEKAGHKRRMVLLALIVLPSLYAASIMYQLLPPKENPILNGVITLLFAVLFAWISVGFWSSVAGIAMLLRKVDRFAVTRDLPKELTFAKDVRAALLFPLYNEEAEKVAAGIKTVWRSLRALNMQDHFDVFILSDSTSPDAWVREEEAWYDLCRSEQAFGHIFYRRRKSNLKRKSGNIADFCRRWGSDYPYMIVFDADSLIAGETLCRMVQVMEAHPHVGILQTPPKIFGSRSLLARVQQFANHLYGPIFAAGFSYWQLGNAQYWGHNAIIRIEPFMRYCQLPVLPGKAPLGGEILSHDFVESALIRRAGYGVWLAYDLGGSYEECPPSLVDELVRDRRWCQGNLQHSRLLFTKGFFPTHRALFINGIMSYVSALLWCLFLMVSSLQVILDLFTVPVYFAQQPSLFPDWPQYFPTWALSLLGGTCALLFFPKVFALYLAWKKGVARAFGGCAAMTASCVAEVLVSTLLAPVRMIFHSFFVLTTLLGFKVSWNAQNRGDSGTPWGNAWRFHWWGALLGIVWGGIMYLINPGYFIWLSPIVFGLVISIPLSVYTSRVSLGMGAKRLKLFLTPADTEPADELQQLQDRLDEPQQYSPFELSVEEGFTRAVVVPKTFALHRSLAHARKPTPKREAQWERLVDKALRSGPGGLTKREKLAVLNDPQCLTRLHLSVWQQDEEDAARWGIR